jgi:hypothetical protein
MGNYVIADLGNYVIATQSNLGNFEIADSVFIVDRRWVHIVTAFEGPRRSVHERIRHQRFPFSWPRTLAGSLPGKGLRRRHRQPVHRS